jgi:hypothetical protein
VPRNDVSGVDPPKWTYLNLIQKPPMAGRGALALAEPADSELAPSFGPRDDARERQRAFGMVSRAVTRGEFPREDLRSQ